MIPSVQVGAGIPLQSTQMSMAQSALPQQSVAQSAVQQNMAPVQAGSILQLPPGSMVPVQAGNSIVYVPTQPIATQQVSAQPQVQYQTQTYQAPVETQFDPSTANLQEAPQYGNTTTPQLKTLQPRIVRNELPPQYKRVVLPAKVITTRLPPIGPPPTPELNFQLPPPAETYQSVTVPQPVQTVQSVMVPQPVQTVQSVMMPMSVQAPQYQTASVPMPAYQTASIPQLSQPNFGTTSVTAQY
jgi:hypothetical protein